MKKIPFVQTSVFVDERYDFSGNQLATFWDDKKNNLKDLEMQGIALEMNFSESTFIFDSRNKECSKKVRIFTPVKELPFAGHPTIGTAFVLKDKGIINKKAAETILELGIGPIKVFFLENGEIAMLQPEPEFLEEYKNREHIAEILGIKESDISQKYPMQAVSTGFPFLIVVLKNLEIVKSISLNAQKQLEYLKDFITQKLLVFSSETFHNESSVHVRMFAPSVGVLEDPATGSAAGPLCAYLDKYEVLENYSAGDRIFIEQGFEIRRPSQLIGKVIKEDNKIMNVLISGKVKKIAEGNFFI